MPGPCAYTPSITASFLVFVCTHSGKELCGIYRQLYSSRCYNPHPRPTVCLMTCSCWQKVSLLSFFDQCCRSHMLLHLPGQICQDHAFALICYRYTVHPSRTCKIHSSQKVLSCSNCHVTGTCTDAVSTRARMHTVRPDMLHGHWGAEGCCMCCVGRQIYFGPVADVEEFFAGTGFRCPPRTDVSDFLQEVTSRKDQVCWLGWHLHACRPSLLMG